LDGGVDGGALAVEVAEGLDDGVGAGVGFVGIDVVEVVGFVGGIVAAAGFGVGGGVDAGFGVGVAGFGVD
jgi:hypothetical protein